MSSWNPDSWVWQRAFDLFDRADRLQRQIFQLNRSTPAKPTWEPPADVFETSGELRIEIALPGVKPDDVSSSIDHGVLTVRGTRRIPSRYRRARVHRLEIPSGDFERRIALPAGRYELAEHELTYGCLVVTLRKRSGGNR